MSPQRAPGEPPLWLSNETLRYVIGDHLTSWSHTKDIFWTLCFNVRSHSVALTGLSFAILLPPSPESWNYRHVPPWPVAIFWITCGDSISTYSQDGGWALLVEWWPGALPLCPPPQPGGWIYAWNLGQRRHGHHPFFATSVSKALFLEIGLSLSLLLWCGYDASAAKECVWKTSSSIVPLQRMLKAWPNIKAVKYIFKHILGIYCILSPWHGFIWHIILLLPRLEPSLHFWTEFSNYFKCSTRFAQCEPL